MATLITPDGQQTEVNAADPTQGFTLVELYKLIGCRYVEKITLSDGRLMWMDEEAKLHTTSFINARATRLLWEAGGLPSDYIVGTILITTEGEVI